MSVTVENGPNTITSELAGKTVAQIRSILRQALNIDPLAKAYIEGGEVREIHVIRDGDKLEFIKGRGKKAFSSSVADQLAEGSAVTRPQAVHCAAVPEHETEATGPFLAIRSEDEYDAAVACLNDLIDEIGDHPENPRYRLIETLSVLIQAYDREHHTLPEASSRQVVRFLMEEHGLTQKDLPEIGSQGVVSELLRGKRVLNLRQIQALAARFRVDPGTFIDRQPASRQPIGKDKKTRGRRRLAHNGRL